MVIANSDSTNTLVSLEDNNKTNNNNNNNNNTYGGCCNQQQQYHQDNKDGIVINIDIENSNTVLSGDCDEYIRTEILIPVQQLEDSSSNNNDVVDSDDDGDDDDDDMIARVDDVTTSVNSQQQQQQQFVPLYLPKNGRVDVVLNQVPQLAVRCDELLSMPTKHYTTSSNERILYVGQGERANVTTNCTDCDVIVSDKATTCHIVAFRSSTSSSGSIATTTTSMSSSTKTSTDIPPPLTSMAHIDGTAYESCIRTMLDEHIQYHHQYEHQYSSDEEEEKKSSDIIDDNHRPQGTTTANSHRQVVIEVHIVGGFNDTTSTSSSISDWLLRLLAQLALEYKSQRQQRQQQYYPDVQVVLPTCAISCMNDTGHSSPVGRGLGINIRTGKAYLAKCDDAVTGPCAVLRSVRVWSGPSTRLSCIHNSVSNQHQHHHRHHHHHHHRLHHQQQQHPLYITVQPFRFQPFNDIKTLLTLPDHILIQYTSTSPDVEEDGFCMSVRKALRFLLTHNCHRIFGTNLDHPLVYERVLWNTTANTSMILREEDHGTSSINEVWRLVHSR